MKTKILKIHNYYRTPEFPLAVSLLLQFPLEAIDRDPENPSKLTFLFLKSDELQSVVESFWKKELKIEPTAFYNASRELKSRMRADSF